MDLQNLPNQIKDNSTLPVSPRYLKDHKCTTALAAIQSPAPSIAKIKRDHDVQHLKIGIGVILISLYKVRYSKTKPSKELTTQFTEWLLVDYYYLKLQEIELALLNYDGEDFHVIDLKVLKTMVEEYVRDERIPAYNQIKSQPKKEPGKKKITEPVPMPDYVKKKINELAVKSRFKVLTDNTIEGKLKAKGVPNFEQVISDLRKEWKAEYKVLKDYHDEAIKTVKKEDVKIPFKSLKSFMEMKERDFIKKL